MEVLDEGFNKKLDPNSPVVGVLKRSADKYKAQILNGRVAAYVLVFLHLVIVFFGFFNSENDALYIGIELLFYLILYLIGLNKMKDSPKVAFIIVLSTYMLCQFLGLMLVGFEAIYNGIIAKGIVLFFLINGIHGAIEFKKVNEQLNRYGEEVRL